MTDEKTMRPVYYMGKRLNDAGIPKHTFCDDEGSWHYPKGKDSQFYGIQIGEEYSVESNDGTTTFPSIWYDAATGNTHDAAEKWQAQHRVEIEKNKAKNKTISPQLDDLIEQLREAVGLMTVNERTAFLTHLITRFMNWR